MVVHFDLAGLVTAVLGGVAVIGLLWAWGGAKAIWKMPAYQNEILEEIRLMRLTLWSMFPGTEDKVRSYYEEHKKKGNGHSLADFGKIDLDE